jgi:antitoxin component YwqK of YwqJK toxin-antitoxin module
MILMRWIFPLVLLGLSAEPVANPLNEYHRKSNPADGEHVVYFKDGKPAEKFSTAGRNLQGSFTMYRKDGTIEQLLHFDQGRFNDTEFYYSAKGHLVRMEVYRHDTLLFFCQSEYYKGNLKSMNYELNFDRDSLRPFPFLGVMENGNTVSWDPMSSIRTLACRGKKTNYYENGKIREEYELENGMYEGAFRSYDENGHLTCIGNYHLGKQDGIFRYFDPEGRVYENEKWQNGKPVK